MDYAAGMSWGYRAGRGGWRTEAADRSMRLMVARLGVTWTTLAVSALQAGPHATRIGFRDAPTVDDDDVRTAIGRARALGLRVCLKPMVDCASRARRARIAFPDDDGTGWAEWFRSYTEFLEHYAQIAAGTGCEMFCVGAELIGSQHRSADWRAAIGRVREVYRGSVTYDCDTYGEDRLGWWDAVDVIGSSGYYPVGSWDAELDRIEAVVRAHGKPFMFVEGGCPSREGAQHRPYDWRHAGPPSQSAQAAFYADALSAIERHPWVRGFQMWDWRAELYPEAEAAADTDYCPFGKSAERLIREHCARQV